MSKISDETQNDIKYYANKKCIAPLIADVCNTREEVDAVLKCISIIKDNAHTYHHAVSIAPHDVKGKQKALFKLLDEAKNQDERDDILLEWESASPIRSQTKVIKDDILDSCRYVLKNASIGKKRIDKIIPLLTWHLMYDEDMLEDLSEEIQKLLNFIKSF